MFNNINPEDYLPFSVHAIPTQRSEIRVQLVMYLSLVFYDFNTSHEEVNKKRSQALIFITALSGFGPFCSLIFAMYRVLLRFTIHLIFYVNYCLHRFHLMCQHISPPISLPLSLPPPPLPLFSLKQIHTLPSCLAFFKNETTTKFRLFATQLFHSYF